MEYYPVLKRKDVPTRATTWVNPEDTMQSDISQSQKDKDDMIPLTRATERAQIHRGRK